MSTMVQLSEDSNEFEPLARPLPWFKNSLAAILSRALRETGAARGLIGRPGMEEIHAHAARPQGIIVPLYQLPAETGGESALNVHSRHASHTMPKRSIGPMTLFFEEPGIDVALTDSCLDGLARQAESVLEQYRIYQRASHQLGVDISSVALGSSQALRSMQAAIAKIAQSPLPVLIEAEFGSDVIAVAAAAHCWNGRTHCPFVTLRCACQQPHEFQRNLCAAMKKAVGGSLFLCEVDTLNDAMQRDLLSVLSAGMSHSSFMEQNVRLLSAANCSIACMVSEGRFCRFLRAQLEMLRIDVPPLRERREDIGPLVEYEIGTRLGLQKSLSEEAMRAFERYHWPGNIGELRQTVSRLAVMSDADCIALEDVAAHLPLQGGERAWPQTAAALPSELRESEIASVEDAGTAQAAEAITELARSLATGTAADLTQYGLGVQRALLYMSKQYQTDISLTELAENAYLSASHLSFLFKKMLGVSFKVLLAEVRIEKAKKLLAEKPELSVTEVSLDSGFGDLSHFERTFKRIVGVNPREYRRRHSAVRPLAGLRIEARKPPRIESSGDCNMPSGVHR